ncbi:MAG: hypothetical protein IPK35_20790 [Saprospiraceae bacterium]|nr:hypothetical protein [Saprospiraceae bacterium]
MTERCDSKIEWELNLVKEPSAHLTAWSCCFIGQNAVFGGRNRLSFWIFRL